MMDVRPNTVSGAPRCDDAVRILRDAAALLSKPGTWRQGGWAFTSDRKWCLPTDPDAACWCVRGAIAHVVGSMMPDRTGAAEDALRRFLGRDGLSQWNDMRGLTQSGVVSALIGAAERLEAGP